MNQDIFSSQEMGTEWTDYRCKSGQTLFIYNKVTGEHKWPTQYNNVSGILIVCSFYQYLHYILVAPNSNSFVDIGQ